MVHMFCSAPVVLVIYMFMFGEAEPDLGDLIQVAVWCTLYTVTYVFDCYILSDGLTRVFH